MNDAIKTGRHPKALYVLFFTEMWERFAYYLMVGILLLYTIDTTTGGKGFSQQVGADITGSFIALIYLTPFIGGLIADRYLGYIKSIFIGGLLMASGYLLLGLPGNTAMFIALCLIIVGNGFFKPNISTLLGNIYNREDLKPLKDNAYNIFYMGINIGAFVCNFVAAYLRNKYGWGYAFSAAGIGLLIGLVILAANLDKVKVGDVKKPVQPEDMTLGQISSYVFLPAVIAAVIGWFIPSIMFGHAIMGTKASDAFLFACIPVIAFYVSLWIKARGTDKKAIGSLLFIFAVAVAFWTIYNQNATGLTLWAEKHTDRVASPTTASITAKIFPMQEVTDTPRLVNKVNEFFVEVKDEKGNPVQVAGPDPYFNNVPKEEWPKGKTVKLTNTELFQSINPLFIVLLTLIFVPLFDYLRTKGKEPTTANKFGMAMFISGLSALIMVFAVMSVPSVYTHKTSPLWLWGTYFVFTISEIFLSPIGLSFVSKLSPPRLTALMMGGWFLAISLGGKMAGVMTSFWDDFTDKRMFFLILFVAATIGGILIYSRIKSLNQIVKEKTGSA
ncbi:MAG TPA: peptide MFS transporter [Chitinophagaceae bacterium]|nr:peptide MFS transporter [Chitinophagaceae bacterium]